MEELTKTWDRIFDQQGKVFTEPHEDFSLILPRLRERKASRVLDLGSGLGRQVIFLARHGLSVFGIDASPKGIGMARQGRRVTRI